MRKAIVVVDLGFGDAGKGSVVDYLVREHEAAAVIRYNGGPQAAHRVVLEDGREHVFSQFGAGTLVPGVETYLSQHMFINPLNLPPEEAHLRSLGIDDAYDRLAVSEFCPIITPFHVAANRLRELARGVNRHGSCGQGVGEAMKDYLDGNVLLARHLSYRDLLERLTVLQGAKRHELAPIMAALRARGVDTDRIAASLDSTRLPGLVDDYRAFVEQVRIVSANHLPELHDRGPVVYEGAQGVLLDQDHGFHPYTTWTRTTTWNARTLLSHHDVRDVEVIGVLRAYGTRHGPGPFPTEDETLDLSDAVNDLDRWQGAWRVGHFDAVLADYAINVNGFVTGLALTCLDRIPDEWQLCKSYTYTGTLPDLDFYFEHNGNEITRIRPTPKVGHGHAHTEALTNRLLTVEPNYVSYPADDIKAAIWKWLGLPIVLTSYGPTAAGKVTSKERVFA